MTEELSPQEHYKLELAKRIGKKKLERLEALRFVERLVKRRVFHRRSVTPSNKRPAAYIDPETGDEYITAHYNKLKKEYKQLKEEIGDI